MDNLFSKKTFVVLIASTMAIALFLFLRRPRPPHAEVAVFSAEKEEAKGITGAVEMKPLVTAPRELPISSPTPHVCQPLWGDISKLQLGGALQEQLLEIKKLSLGECKQPPGVLSTFHQSFVAACLDSKAAEMAPENCVLASLLYRAQLQHFLTAGMAAKDINDPKLLVDKMTATINSDPQISAEMAERLLELKPDLYPAAKASLAGRFLDAQRNSEGNEASPKFDAVDTALRRARDMNPKDSASHLEMELLTLMVRHRDPKAVLSRAQAIADDYPNLAVGPYYVAWAYYKSGDLPAAESNLRIAFQREPNEPRSGSTMQKMKRGEANAFQASQSFEDISQSVKD